MLGEACGGMVCRGVSRREGTGMMGLSPVSVDGLGHVSADPVAMAAAQLGFPIRTRGLRHTVCLRGPGTQ